MKTMLRSIVWVLAFVTASAQATVSVFTSDTAFASATTHYFDSVAPTDPFGPGYTNFGSPGNVAVPASGSVATFSSTPGFDVYAYLGGLPQGYGPTTTWLSSEGAGTPNNVTVAIVPGYKAVGFYYASHLNFNDGVTDNATITVTTPGASFSGNFPATTKTIAFIGFSSSSSDITSVSFSQASGQTQLALDFTRFVVSTTPVPEPSIFLMLGAGLAVIGALGRRRRT